MSLSRLLRGESRLRRCIRKGKQALTRVDAGRVEDGEGTRVLDSLNLDEATRVDFADQPRWDYLVATRHAALAIIGVEVHPATAGTAKEVVAKKRSSASLLASELKAGETVRQWFWIASGSTRLTPTTPEYRQLVAAGIRFVGSRLHLDRVIKR